MILRLITILILFNLLIPSASATLEQAHTKVDLLSEVISVKPGEPFWVAVRMRMDPEWHVYWQNPGDSGLPPSLRWSLPSGWTAGDIQWPLPEKINLPPLRSYGYTKEVLFLVEIKTTVPAVSSPAEIKADISWLTCKVDCIPGKGQISTSVNVGENTAVDPQISAAFGQTRRRWPKASLPWNVQVKQTPQTWIMSFSDGAAPFAAYFFPEREDVILHAADQKLTAQSNGFTLEIPKSNLLTQAPPSLSGILETGETGFLVNVPLQASGGPAMSLVIACLFALVGGVILNVMPCVLPVLSLKVIGLTAHRMNRRESLLSGITFAAGVVVSFWMLAGLLLAIKSAGTQIGWGFQFQSPWFVGFMALVFFILALNLFGVFEIGLGLTGIGGVTQTAKGWQRDFANGLLATVVATPCTAPFMGTAITYGLTQPAFTSILIFTCLGLGMALPMVALCAFPGLLKFLPKPGPWMNTMKRVMGIFMLASALWLCWVLALQLNVLSGKNEWREFSPPFIEQLKREKKDYFLDFTAAWCLTCQVNDRLVLQDRKVVEKFKDHSIILVKADWTKYDPVITSALSGYGRNSIPLYVYYSARTGQEYVLGETITVPNLIELLDHNK